VKRDTFERDFILEFVPGPALPSPGIFAPESSLLWHRLNAHWFVIVRAVAEERGVSPWR
jgi:hypothetical protein